jgi:hypothetical protein
MNYFTVKCYIRLLGNITDERGVPKMTPEEIDNCDEKFCLVDQSGECNLEIGKWDLPIKKPTVWDLKALISKDDLIRERRLYLKKNYDENIHHLLMKKSFLKKLFPNLDLLIQEEIEETVQSEN